MEIALYDKIQNPLDAVDRFGVAIGKSGMFGCDNENAGKVLAMICIIERKSPTEILRTYDIIGGKLRKKAMAAYAEFRSKGGKVRWIATGEDGREAKAEFEFENNKVTLSYTIDQAKRAKLVKENSGWDKNPANMLRARVISNALGMLCPEIFAGDEGEDYSTPGGAEIKLSPSPTAEPPAQKTSTAPTPPAVEVAVVVEPATLPPVAPTTTVAAAPAAAAPIEVKAEPVPEKPRGMLSDETVGKLQEAIGEHSAKAGAWFIKEGWLQPGQDLSFLSETRANRILKQTASFIRAVTGSAS